LPCARSHAGERLWFHNLNGLTEVLQKPLFERLRTPAADKRHLVYDAGHFGFPRSEMIREVLAWLDRYLGPVASSSP
jgi:hypothetical protein